MTAGDCLLVERADGYFDLFKVLPNGTRCAIYRGIVDAHIARRLAMAKLEPHGRAVYFKDESEPDSKIRRLAL